MKYSNKSSPGKQSLATGLLGLLLMKRLLQKILTLSLLLLAANTQAEVILYNLSTAGASCAPPSSNGIAAAAGDVNGDGFDDMRICDRVYSGIDGSVLYAGGVWEAGDVNNDGYGDLNQIATQTLVSGADGSTLTGFLYDEHIGDVNGDGYLDVANFVGNNVAVYSATGALLYTIDGFVIDVFPESSSVRNAGDVNLDGRTDLVIAACGDHPFFGSLWCRVQLHSGTDGALINLLYQENVDAFTPVSVDGIGDVNGNGGSEVIWGYPCAPGSVYSPDYCKGWGVVEGSNAVNLWSFTGSNWSFMGARVRGMGDVNGDGIPDVMVQAGGTRGQHSAPDSFSIRSGNNGAIIAQHYGKGYAAGDVNSDGYADYMMFVSGVVSVHSGAHIALDADGDGIAGGLDQFPLHAAASSDVDNDGHPGSWNVVCDTACQAASGLILDNCPNVSNADQANTDGDAQGNACDADDDNDGVFDTTDSFPQDASQWTGNNNILYAFNGDSALEEFGYSVSGAGDVNGDGYADVIAGAYRDDNNGTNSGSARVFSGLNGSILYVFNGDSANEQFGYSVSGAGDVNGDGYADVIVGAYLDDNNGTDSGSARVFSGLNGSILYVFNGDSANEQFGYSVSDAGDVNGDGYADMIVGEPFDTDNGSWSGSAQVFSGATGAILYTFSGDNEFDQFGKSVSGAGDVNGDGYDDLIVGAYEDDNNGTQSGSARVFSGATGTILYTFNGDNANDYFGVSVGGAGDVNGDGYADVIVGAYRDDNNGTDSGSARVLSGANGSILYTFNGDSANDYFGYSVSVEGDVNNDGYADVIVGAYGDDNNGTGSGSARVLSGANGSVLYTFNGDSANDYFGYSVSAAGDMNNDGYVDMIAGAYLNDLNGSHSGSARVFSGRGLWTNTDGDGQNDAVDADDDNDGVADTYDLYPLDNTQAGDYDSDGVEGLVDNCPSASNSDQLNTDGDSQGDVCDTDDDNDGVADSSDAFDFDPAESADSDGDGTGNNADTDDDNDTVLDLSDNCPLTANSNQANFDGDAQGDACDSDDDNDGIPDTSDPTPRGGVDTDGDGTPDSTDTDDDNDTVLDLSDNCPSIANGNQANFDGDAQGDVCDTDDDNDGVADSSDAFDFDPAESVDSDGDGTGNNADTDDDNDTVLDLSDNCPLTANSNQANFDGDAQGDACDSDDDNDGTPDISDPTPRGGVDTDGDGTPDSTDTDDDNDTMPDSWEVAYGLNPLVNDLSHVDFDGDGFTNRQEYRNGTDPTVKQVMLTGDFDQDLDSDLLFQASDGTVTLWGLENASKVSSKWLGVMAAKVKQIAASVVYFQYDDGAKDVYFWWLREAVIESADRDICSHTGYSLAGMGRLKAGKSYQVYENSGGSMVVCRPAGPTLKVYLGTWAGQSVATLADVDQDGDDDVITQDLGSNLNVIGIENGEKISARWIGAWAGYKVVGAGDADGDGDDDIFMETEAGSVLVVVMENGVKQTARWIGAWSGNRIKGLGDIDKDGDVDLIQQNPANGSVQVVEIENAQKVTGRWLGTFAYTVKGVLDVDRDGDMDLAMQSASGGVALVVLEAGNKVGGARWLGSNSGSLLLF